MGGLLPDAEDVEANKEDEMWRVVYLMPAVIGIVEIILITLVFKLEPITFCIRNDDNEQSMQHMRRLYRKIDPKSPETIE